jgi:hypothetical protein
MEKRNNQNQSQQNQSPYERNNMNQAQGGKQGQGRDANCDERCNQNEERGGRNESAGKSAQSQGKSSREQCDQACKDESMTSTGRHMRGESSRNDERK